VTTELALMEGVERTNAIIVHPQQRTGLVQCNPYAMNINRERNCYACGGFRHMAQHCWNRGQRSGVIKGRRLEYGRRRERNHKQLDHLKEEENLESLD